MSSKTKSPLLISTPEVEKFGRISQNRIPVGTLELFHEQCEREPLPDGLKKAAELLLSRSAVAIFFVDIHKPQDPLYDGDPTTAIDDMLGFNDHGGGSESAFKIAIKRPDTEGRLKQHVLYSPPSDDGNPVNTTFARASLGTPFVPADDREDTRVGVPNPLKTVGTSKALGHGSNYRYYVLGDDSAPEALAKSFEQVGFDFQDKPYERDTYDGLKTQASDAIDQAKAQGIPYPSWPNGQFEEQAKKLNN